MRQELLTPASTGTCPPPGTAGLPRGTWGAWSVGSGVRVPLWGRAAVPPLPPAPPGSLPSAPGVLKARRSCRETRSGLPAREGPAARSGGTERSGGDSSGCPWAPTAARSEPQLLPGIPGGLRSSAPSPHPGASGAAPRPSRPSPCPCQPTASPPKCGQRAQRFPLLPSGGKLPVPRRAPPARAPAPVHVRVPAAAACISCIFQEKKVSGSLQRRRLRSSRAALLPNAAALAARGLGRAAPAWHRHPELPPCPPPCPRRSPRGSGRSGMSPARFSFCSQRAAN